MNGSRGFVAHMAAALMLAAIVPMPNGVHAQTRMTDAEMARQLGLAPGQSIRFFPVGADTAWTKRFALDLRDDDAMKIALAARSNLGEVVTDLFRQRRPPELLVFTRLDPRFAGPAASAVTAFNARDDVSAGRPSRKPPQNAVLTYVVSAADFGLGTSAYPYLDENMERDCHRRLCMVVAVDLEDPEHLDVAVAQIDRVATTWNGRDWSRALPREGQQFDSVGQMSAYRSLLASGLEVMPAYNPGTYSYVLGTVVKPAGRQGVFGSFVTIGFVGRDSKRPE